MTEQSWYDQFVNTLPSPFKQLVQGAEYFSQTIEPAVSNASFNVDDNTLGQSEYNFAYTTFPENISNDDVGHYMVININVPVALTNASTPRTSYQNGLGLIASQTLTNQASKVDALRFGGAENIAATGPVGEEALAVPRFTRRIKEAIALYMPTPVVFNTQNDYQDISLSSFGTNLLSQVGGAIGGRLGSEAGAVTGANLADAAGRAIGNVAGLARYPINPRVEVIYSKSSLRQFVFEFLLAPRNEKESISMEKIIRTLRFHAVPEIDPNTFGWTFIPPAELDITFYNKGVENRHIPRINTCVIDRIEVDYAPQGEYSTFSNGHPVAARLSLGLREVEILHKRRVLQGF